MHEEDVSVAYHTAMSKSGGQGWLRPVGFQGLRYVQFPFLLLRRSFWGLVLGLNWWDIIDEQVLVGGAFLVQSHLKQISRFVVTEVEKNGKPRSADDKHNVVSMELKDGGLSFQAPGPPIVFHLKRK